MAFTATLMAWSIIDFGRNMGPHLGDAVVALRWATDYLLKATAVPNVVYVQVGDAFRDHSCWERPEDMDTPRTVYKVDPAHPGSDVAGETAAALAAGSIVFRGRDPGYSRVLLNRAVRVSSSRRLARAMHVSGFSLGFSGANCVGYTPSLPLCSKFKNPVRCFYFVLVVH